MKSSNDKGVRTLFMLMNLDLLMKEHRRMAGEKEGKKFMENRVVTLDQEQALLQENEGKNS